MIPSHCRVKHDPEAGLYGDCVRACVASLLDIATPETVPHFYHDGCDGETGNARLVEYLATLGYVPFWCFFPGDHSIDEILETQSVNNPDVHYMLFGCTRAGNDHVVIAKGNKIVHDPAWFTSPMISPNSNGYWVVMVIAKV